MARPRGIMGTTLALLLIAGALASVCGCARREARFGEASGTVAATGSATASTTATGPAAAAQTTSPAPGAAPTTEGVAPASGSASGLSSQDASTLDAELSAIQSELDRLSVPSDSDFDNIGAGLK